MIYLVTGGTGFIGKSIIAHLLRGPANKVISYSRRWEDSERLLSEMKSSRLRVINGDICDYRNLSFALKGVDRVFHTAAYKSVPSGEYNPFEVTRVNVEGTQNLIHAAIERNVKRVLFISSDKACDPINLYGKTKAIGESLVINANNLGTTRFAVARYGNVIGSTGSILPVFLKMKHHNNQIRVTDLNMTRFWFPKADAVEFVLSCMINMTRGGETFVPKMASSNMQTFVDAFSIATNWEMDSENVKIIGLRPGEKFDEAMISPNEVDRAIDMQDHFLIVPFQHDWDSNWRDGLPPNKVMEKYTSFNAQRVGIHTLAKFLKEAIDSMAEV